MREGCICNANRPLGSPLDLTCRKIAWVDLGFFLGSPYSSIENSQEGFVPYPLCYHSLAVGCGWVEIRVFPGVVSLFHLGNDILCLLEGGF